MQKLFLWQVSFSPNKFNCAVKRLQIIYRTQSLSLILGPSRQLKTVCVAGLHIQFLNPFHEGPRFRKRFFDPRVPIHGGYLKSVCVRHINGTLNVMRARGHTQIQRYTHINKLHTFFRHVLTYILSIKIEPMKHCMY